MRDHLEKRVRNRNKIKYFKNINFISFFLGIFNNYSKTFERKTFLGEEIPQIGEKYKFKFFNISSDQCYLNHKYKFKIETIFSKCYFRKELNNKTYFFLGIVIRNHFGMGLKL